MANQTYRNLDDVIPSVVMNRAARKMDGYFGVPMIVKGATEQSGNKGGYVRATVATLENPNEEFYFNTGALQPCDLLRYLMANGGFPVAVVFVQDDQRVLMTPYKPGKAERVAK